MARKKGSSKKSSSSGSGTKLKFGSPAWRAKYAKKGSGRKKKK